MQLFPNSSPEFWVRLWQEARENSPMARRRCRSEQEMVDNWSRRARSFARRTGNAGGQGRQRAALDLLEQEGVLGPEVRVLDIGAGPGNFAIPMARLAGQVTALEPAAEMVKIMEARAGAEQLENITVIRRTWQEIQLEEDGLAGKFDLVFASMTPGVRDPETLQKMIGASRDYCYLSGFSGRRWGEAHSELWRRFFNEDIGESPGDIIYPFGLLYAMGYRPSLRFAAGRQVQEQTPEEAIENLVRFFWGYLDITAGVRREIEEYVQKRAGDGIFRQRINGCHGMMLWRVERAPAAPQ
ncbi:methyltransferase, FkbM family [Desulfotomaculum arcticum]|uniref:Methyltransferase, FkbM family n=1 Tax=Desulfotruncus arcticus DSM 17038 TaxID=1121424 RepID=A0A1I2NUW6_9FIRM|nr:class I SAM-dependent methyltransferase [Desulfotruncus arcticus]SFG07672.1 methyltransferase, FkbM family [Desulfotomaculum arcticum] [Desulfotruncus arcticus DSM 17038]